VLRNLSVGYQVDEWRDGTDASGARTRTAVKWTIKEASFVAVGADPRARTRQQGTGRAAVNRQIRELASSLGVRSALTDDLIDREASLEEARADILGELQTRGEVHIRTAHNRQALDDPENFIRTVGEGLYARATGATPSAPARQFAGLTVPMIAAECLRRTGMVTQMMTPDALVTRALQTTSDFALILADTVGRTLRDSYKVPASGVRVLARETTAQDFRTKHRLMLDTSGLTLEKTNEDGEYKSGAMAEADATYAVDSYGRIIGISRKALVNDDLGAFTDIPRRLGMAAVNFQAQFLTNIVTSDPVMTEDGDTLFHADHSNLAAAGATPSVATLTAARLAMRRQTGQSGGLISVTPRWLLLPPELETVGEQLLTALLATELANVNPFSGRLQLAIEPRLTDAFAWYLVADPAELDGLEFAYLAGAPGPQVESRPGFEVDGI
jgi:hypothetical protein